MLTIRVEHSRDNHEGHVARKYTVARDAEALVLTIYPADQPDGSTPTKIVMRPGAVAFVMNEAGNTVDKVLVHPRHAALRQTQHGG